MQYTLLGIIIFLVLVIVFQWKKIDKMKKVIFRLSKLLNGKTPHDLDL